MRDRPNAGSPAPTERATPWIIAVAACILLAVGVGLAFSDRAASAGAAWGVGFLLVALLLISKFKRIKGFGFEAEMWEQKQAEAAALVDQLKSLSKVAVAADERAREVRPDRIIIDGVTGRQQPSMAVGCGHPPDVSLESASVCVVEAGGRIVREAKVASEPDALIAWFGKLAVKVSRIGLEAGPLSQWLYAGMREAGLPVELLETRHVRDAFKAMPVKTDRNDARGIAQLMRLGWFRPVHCKSLPAQELRAVLTARKLVQGKKHDIEMSLRGILRGFGLKVGLTTTRSFEGRVRELVEGHPTLLAVADALLLARAILGEQLGKLQKRLVSLARDDTRARLLMSTPGVGVLVALTYVAAIDDPARFRSSKAVGAHFGLTPKKYHATGASGYCRQHAAIFSGGA
jgi:transposase